VGGFPGKADRRTERRLALVHNIATALNEILSLLSSLDFKEENNVISIES